MNYLEDDLDDVAADFAVSWDGKDSELWDFLESTDAQSVGLQGLAGAFLHPQLFLPLSQNPGGGRAFSLASW